ncbi:MAG: hypothetical protein NXI32_27095 [bacterium]|nr:hypothetical protein [bacterium]
MRLSKEETDELLRQIGLTEDQEIDCDQCLALVAEFAEQEACGARVRAALEAVRQHLAICGECQEEYAALCLTLDNAETKPNG